MRKILISILLAGAAAPASPRRSPAPARRPAKRARAAPARLEQTPADGAPAGNRSRAIARERSKHASRSEQRPQRAVAVDCRGQRDGSSRPVSTSSGARRFSGDGSWRPGATRQRRSGGDQRQQAASQQPSARQSRARCASPDQRSGRRTCMRPRTRTPDRQRHVRSRGNRSRPQAALEQPPRANGRAGTPTGATTAATTGGDYRDRHRSIFHLGFYYDPFGWGYRPYQHRLPAVAELLQQQLLDQRSVAVPAALRAAGTTAGSATGTTRCWSTLYSGQVVDVIHNFFW